MKGGGTTMKKSVSSISRIALVITIMCSALATWAQAMTITLKNGTVKTIDVTACDSIRYVGGEFKSATGIGVKIYRNGSTVSEDYLYSQMVSLVISGGQAVTVATPVISPAGGTFTEAQTVTITCATAGATVYYTIDGTNPISSSSARSGTSPVSFTVSSTTTVRAVALLNSTPSSEATATFTISSSTTNNNVNANWWSSNYTRNVGEMTYTPKTAGFYRLEVPHISDKTTTSWVMKQTSAYGVTYFLEWDNDLIANRWTCYQLHAGNLESNVKRKDAFKEDSELPSATRSILSDYSGSGFSRGHLCPSADRLCSSEQNSQTFFLSNMQPQYQSHNGAQWANLEGDVRKWAEMSTCDTLYVVKAATIDNITLNGTTKSGLKSVKCNNRLPVPDYFYMALLAYNKSTNTYYAMGIWTYHYNASSEKQSAEYITIDELEKRTGIDFFCNLPDDIEAQVESTLDKSYWSAGATLNR